MSVEREQLDPAQHNEVVNNSDHGPGDACSCCKAIAARAIHELEEALTSGTPYERFEAPEAASKRRHAPELGFASRTAFQYFFDQAKVTSGSVKRKSISNAETGSSRGKTDQPNHSANKSNETQSSTVATPEGQEKWHDDDIVPVTKKVSLWQGWQGLAVMFFGVWVPAALVALGSISIPKRLTLVLLNHPLETAIELLLVLGIPIVNYVTWSALCKNDLRFSIRRGIALGSAIATATLVACTCSAALFWGCKDLQAEISTNFATGFCFLAILGSISSAISLFLLRRVLASREFENSRKHVLAYALTGIVVSTLALLASETRPFCVRYAEKLATSSAEQDRVLGLDLLRKLDAKRDVGMECADPRAAGLVGLFIPVRTSARHQLYFALTGKPYAFQDNGKTDLSSMPDEYVTRRVVGDIVPGLSLMRSSLMGTIHPRTFSARLNWTLVIKNDSDEAQETRAELQLPPGAVIDGMTYWYEGQPVSADFASSVNLGQTNYQVQAENSSAIVTDLGHGRELIHCNRLPQEHELKVMVSIVAPLKPNGTGRASVVLPRLIAANFDLTGEHQLQLHSSALLSCAAKNLRPAVTNSGEKVLAGGLSKQQLSESSIVVEAATTEVLEPRVVFDNVATQLWKEEVEEKIEASKRQHETENKQQVVLMLDGSKGFQQQLSNLNQAITKNSAHTYADKPLIKMIKPIYSVQSIKKIDAVPPKKLVVVVDGSLTMTKHREEIATALAQLPSNVPVSLIIASQEEPQLAEATSLTKGLGSLKQATFAGGQDNLQSVVKAASLAGETRDGAVLWIHGPQPTLNKEMYIMAPYVSPPTFYEMSIDCGEIDSVEFFKNHSEIGPFLQVPRDKSLAEDISRFTSRWKNDTNDYEVSYKETFQKPAENISVSPQEAQELIALRANEECKRLIANRMTRRALTYASRYGLVTPVSVAFVGGNQAEGAAGGAQTPSMKGSFLERQRQVATYISGVNTAGTVRVNNLANLEALFNIIANLIEVAGGLTGIVIVLHTLVSQAPITRLLGIEVNLGRGQRIALGLGLILFALFVPGCMNWLVASARDANLFS
jgi:hypothetical protein